MSSKQEGISRRSLIKAAMASPLAALSLGAVAKGNGLTHQHSPTWCGPDVVGTLYIRLYTKGCCSGGGIAEVRCSEIHSLIEADFKRKSEWAERLEYHWVSRDGKHEYKAFWSRNGSHRSLPADLRGDDS